MINLDKKIIVLTGATGNLGKSIAQNLCELGTNLILIDKEEKNLNILSSELNLKSHQKVLTLPCNFENEEERNIIINKIIKKYDYLDCIINNAAFTGDTNISGWSEPFANQSLDTWRRAIEVNLTSIFHFSRDFSMLLKKSDDGNIINIASIYGELGPDWKLYEDTNMSNPAAYAASKGGLIQLTRWLATTLSPEIRVNAISPGGIERSQPKNFIKKYKLKTPMNRMASEQDISNAVLFLASKISNYMTGQVLRVDGGWSAW